ncbi:MAG: bile acid:sodium symporter family protein [Alphaproteobacteria bacterium]|nr:bile acid:sodium symporter family protein [Alphaproteobacteria bacterium]
MQFPMTPADLDQVRVGLDAAGRAMVAIALFCMMLGVSLGLRAADFAVVLRAPKLFAGGFLAQVLGLPLATLALIAIAEPPASIALGMIVVAACPGGNVSNALSYFARGDVAYSVSLTAASSAFAALLTPAAILFWSDIYPPTASLLKSIDVNRGAFVIQTTSLLAVPLALGMAVRARFDALATRLQRPVAWTGAALLSAAIFYGVYLMFDDLLPAFAMILPIAILHNLIAFGVGAGAGAALRAPGPQRRSLIFEVGIQNSGLALVILVSQFEGLGGAIAIAAVWGIWHIIAGAVIVAAFREWDRRRAMAPAH